MKLYLGFVLADLEKEVESLKQQQSKPKDSNPDDAALFQVCLFLECDGDICY